MSSEHEQAEWFASLNFHYTFRNRDLFRLTGAIDIATKDRERSLYHIPEDHNLRGCFSLFSPNKAEGEEEAREVAENIFNIVQGGISLIGKTLYTRTDMERSLQQMDELTRYKTNRLLALGREAMTPVTITRAADTEDAIILPFRQASAN